MQKFAYVVLAVTVLSVVAARLSVEPEPPVDPGRAEAAARAEAFAVSVRDAMIRCDNHTRFVLADRDGYEAAPYGDWRAVEFGDDSFTFSYAARARNGLGALVWADFLCEARREGDRWVAEVRRDI